jgi:hypothetical protein
MDVLLVDVDSRIPNLALMKLSAYHKAQGHNVGFDIKDPDLVFASVIFKANKHLVDGLQFWYPSAKINIGGSGYDLASTLPDEIEYMKPDYSLYPEVCASCGNVKKHCRCIMEFFRNKTRIQSRMVRKEHTSHRTIRAINKNLQCVWILQWFHNISRERMAMS